MLRRISQGRPRQFAPRHRERSEAIQVAASVSEWIASPAARDDREAENAGRLL
jgi:hypothetical protein